jgi:WD repeat and SOF domain-containing protein 1
MDEIAEGIKPVNTFLGKHPFNALDHHRKDDLFVTAGHAVELWNPQRSDPVHSFEWGADTVNTVKFSPVEHNLLVSTASDRNVILYDVRQRTPLKKLILKVSKNAYILSFFPFSPFSPILDCVLTQARASTSLRHALLSMHATSPEECALRLSLMDCFTTTIR